MTDDTIGIVFLALVLIAGVVFAHLGENSKRKRREEDRILAAADEIRARRSLGG